MKRLAFLLLCLTFLLSGCYPYSEIQKRFDEQMEAADNEYNALEEQYFDALARIEDLESNIGKMYDMALDLTDYFEDESISFDEAHDRFDTLLYALAEGVS